MGLKIDGERVWFQVTFRDPDAAMRACVDAAPVIDGRRANCNLASLGVHRSKPSTPNKHGIHTYNISFPAYISINLKIITMN